MKLKDLPKGTNLRGVKVKTPEGKEMYWYSHWGYEDGGAGVWLKENMRDTQIHPYTDIKSLKECLEWEVV